MKARALTRDFGRPRLSLIALAMLLVAAASQYLDARDSDRVIWPTLS